MRKKCQIQNVNTRNKEETSAEHIIKLLLPQQLYARTADLLFSTTGFALSADSTEASLLLRKRQLPEIV